MIKLDTFPKVMAALLSVLAIVIGLFVWTTPSCELMENTCEGILVQEEIVPDSRKLPPSPIASEPVIEAPEEQTSAILSAFQVQQDLVILTKAKNWIYLEYKEQNKLAAYQGLSIEEAIKLHPDKFIGYKNSFPLGYLANGMVKSGLLSEDECETFNYAVFADANIPAGDEIYYMVHDDPSKLRNSPLPSFCLSDGHVYHKLN